MKVLITGGAGFIGSALIRYIINHTEDSVVNVDILTYAGNLESINEIQDSPRYVFKKVNICNAFEVSKVLDESEPDVVMHLAAESHVDRSIEGPSDFIQTNIVGTFVLLEQVRKYYERLEGSKRCSFRFHHISTDEVYGDLPHPSDFLDDSTLPLFTENTAYSPSSPYSASKASSDHLVRSWGRTYKLPIVITNCSNNYGPYHFPEKLIPHTILNALSGRSLPVYGDGSQIRDWLFVEDHARALYLVVTKGSVGETYNIGGHNEKTNIEVVHIICDLLEELSPTKPNGVNFYRELISFVGDRPGHDRRYAIDSSKIYNDLGWAPNETFETGMRKTVMWYLNNKEWWSRVLSGSYKLDRLGKSDE